MSSWMSTVLPTPAPPNRPTLPPLAYGRQQVDDLDAGLEHLGGRGEVRDGRGAAVDRPALLDLDVVAQVDRLAEQVEDAAERHLADRAREIGPPVSATSMPRARPSVESMATARTRSSPRCCCTSQTSDVVAAAPRPCGAGDRDGVVDLGQLVGEDGLDDDALDLLDPADVALCFVAVSVVCGRFRQPSSSP